MAQTTPATEVVADHAEGSHDLFDVAWADEVIDGNEARNIAAALDWTVFYADSANVQRAIGVCVIRGGFGGDRHLRLQRQMEELHELAPCVGDPLDAA